MTHNNTISPFTFQSHQVRVVELDGNPWFVAADVCRVLGLTHTAHAVRPLAANEKGSNPITTLGGKQRTTVISESGLYKLVMRSDKPQAREFQDWVTREVLPAIRKDGMYVVGEEKVRTGEMSEDEMTLLVIERLKAKTDRLVAERDVLAVQVANDAPKVAVHDRLVDAKGARTVTEAAKALKISPRDLFQWLADHQWAYRRGGVWQARQDRINAGHLMHHVYLFKDRAGNDNASSQLRITARGMAVLAKALERTAA